MSDVKCPKCDRKWPEGCEQSISIYWYKECIVCKFTPLGNGSNDGTTKEFDLISAERKKELDK